MLKLKTHRAKAECPEVRRKSRMQMNNTIPKNRGQKRLQETVGVPREIQPKDKSEEEDEATTIGTARFCSQKTAATPGSTA